jgi:hypothetical protein
VPATQGFSMRSQRVRLKRIGLPFDLIAGSSKNMLFCVSHSKEEFGEKDPGLLL